MATEPVRIDGDIWVVRTTWFWVFCIITTVLLDFFFYFLELLPGQILRRSFNVELEESLGTWVSTMLTLFTGVVAAAVFAAARKRSSGRETYGWAIVALFFTYVSFDDAAKFHERVGTTFRLKYEHLTETVLESWFPSWGWQLFVAPFFAVVGVYIFYFLWTTVTAPLRAWVLLGVGLLALAVGIDFIEGMSVMNSEAAEHLMRLGEEMIEMFGALAILYVVLATLNAQVTVYLEVANVVPQTDTQNS